MRTERTARWSALAVLLLAGSSAVGRLEPAVGHGAVRRHAVTPGPHARARDLRQAFVRRAESCTLPPPANVIAPIRAGGSRLSPFTRRPLRPCTAKAKSSSTGIEGDKPTPVKIVADTKSEEKATSTKATETPRVTPGRAAASTKDDDPPSITISSKPDPTTSSKDAAPTSTKDSAATSTKDTATSTKGDSSSSKNEPTSTKNTDAASSSSKAQSTEAATSSTPSRPGITIDLPGLSFTLPPITLPTEVRK